jgi:hypothetical protein
LLGTGPRSYRLATAETSAAAATALPPFLPVARMQATGSTTLNIGEALHIGTALLRIGSEGQRAVIHLQNARRVLGNSLVNRVAIYPAFVLEAVLAIAPVEPA